MEFDFLNTRMSEVRDNTPPEGVYMASLITWKPKVTTGGESIISGGFRIQSVVDAPYDGPVADLALVNHTWWMRDSSQDVARRWLSDVVHVTTKDSDDVNFKEGFERAVGVPVKILTENRRDPKTERVYPEVKRFLPQD